MSKPELLDLASVGPATLEDLHLLEIYTIEQLKQAKPDELFARLKKLTNSQQNLCVWDVFAAIIDEAKTGKKSHWSEWSQIRKQSS